MQDDVSTANVRHRSPGTAVGAGAARASVPGAHPAAGSTNGVTARPVRPLRVLHMITRMIVGGAQENTMLSCALIDPRRFPSELLTGTQTGSEGELLSEARKRGVTLHLEPMLVREPNPIKDLLALFRLHAFLRRNRYDVVHTHCTKAGDLGRIAARMAGVPVIIHTHHGLAWRPGVTGLPGVARALERWCAKFSDGLIAVAEPDRQFAIRDGVGVAAQYELIRSGIEIEAYADVAISRAEARQRLGLPDDAFVVVCVARLDYVKAPLDMLAAFEIMARERPEAHLVMVGDGNLRAEVEAAVAKAGLAGRVHLLGLRRDVPEILRASDVLALASLFEGLPRVFPQAMAAGLPIVATNVDGAPDVIVPGETGWMVESRRPDLMAAHLIELARDPERARRMGARGRERVDEFSARRMVERLETLYTRLAARKGLIEA